MGNLSRYFHTLKHLKPIQIRYQVAYRLKNRYFPARLSVSDDIPQFLRINLQNFPEEHAAYSVNQRFTFLNLEHDFGESIDWNYTGHGKLWAYQLNYFGFLHQPDMDPDTGLSLIRHFIASQHGNTEGMEPYPISLRGINWIKFLALNKIWPDNVLQSLHAQYKALQKRLEFHLMGNHLLENGFSLLFAGLLFPDSGFLKDAKRIISRELREQILPDGAHFELSPMYHCIILQKVLDCFNLLKNNMHSEHALQSFLQESAECMCGWLSKVQFTNGDLPMVNDSVHGEFTHPKHLFRYARGLGIDPAKVILNESGYRMYREGGFEMFTDAASIGPDYIPGHAHSDTLSFIIYFRGKPVIVDRAVSTYEKNELRESERGTSSHNTVVVDGLEQTDVWGGFRVGSRAKAEIVSENKRTLEARHDGYKKKRGVLHYRRWIVDPDRIEITDELKGGKYDLAEAHFHFHPDISLKQNDEHSWLAGDVTIRFHGAKSQSILKYPYAMGFNRVTDADKLIVVFDRSLLTQVTGGDKTAQNG